MALSQSNYATLSYDTPRLAILSYRNSWYEFKWTNKGRTQRAKHNFMSKKYGGPRDSDLWWRNAENRPRGAAGGGPRSRRFIANYFIAQHYVISLRREISWITDITTNVVKHLTTNWNKNKLILIINKIANSPRNFERSRSSFLSVQ